MNFLWFNSYTMSDDHNIMERLAVLETKTAAIEETVERVDGNVSEIKIVLGRQRGFIAGAMFVFTPIIAFVTMLAKSFWQNISG